MKITDMLKRPFIVGEMRSSDKRGALQELANALAGGPARFDSDAMLKVLLERERLGSTGIGEGIAIPHGKLAGLEEIMVAFGRSRVGVAFEAMDGKPVHLFFLLMAPENSAGQYLKTLAKLSRMLKDGEFRRQLREAASVDELLRIIGEREDGL